MVPHRADHVKSRIGAPRSEDDCCHTQVPVGLDDVGPARVRFSRQEGVRPSVLMGCANGGSVRKPEQSRPMARESPSAEVTEAACGRAVGRVVSRLRAGLPRSRAPRYPQPHVARGLRRMRIVFGV